MNKEKVKEWMPLVEALALCKKRHHPITKVGLYRAGEKYGFMEVGGKPRLFNKVKMAEWLTAANKKPGPGWERVSKVAINLGISIHSIYFWVRIEKLQAKFIGAGTGVMYVQIDDYNSYFIESIWVCICH